MKSKKIQNLVASVIFLATLFSTTMASASTGDGGKSTNNSTQNILNDMQVKYSEPSAKSSNLKKPFTWKNATVYFELTDRFNNGDTSNDHSYYRRAIRIFFNIRNKS